MKAIGCISGIGSMLLGARQAGFTIYGSWDWRKYYHAVDDYGRNTFTENFLAPFSKEPEEFLKNAELLMSHCECGAYSQLSGANKAFRHRAANDQSDIPKLVDYIRRTKPQFFVADNLPKSLGAVPLEYYHEALPEYDLFPEWVSNYGYGNIQKGRDRFFLIGALKDHAYAFQPSEEAHKLTVADIIGDMAEPGASNLFNHDPCDLMADSPRSFNLGGRGKKNNWAETKLYFQDKKGGHTLNYEAADGREVSRIGFLKGHYDGPSHVLTGGNAIIHNQRNEPYTIRERARIQGFPDDFIFYGTKLNNKGEWSHNENIAMVKQTGKAMPIEFNRYVSEHIADHIQNKPSRATGKRILMDNPEINKAKQWFCKEVGYGNQKAACNACWMHDYCELGVKK